MSKFKVGIIGCGRIGAVYKKAFKDLADKLEVVAAMDKDISRAEEFASHFPGCKAFDDLDGFFNAGPKVVHVCTPHFLHRAHVEAALEAGCDVLTEKPIATTVEDGLHMIETSRRTGHKLGVIFQNRYIEGVQEAKALIEQGAFGEIKGAWSQLDWFRPASYYQCDWKGSWEKEGGGVVIDQAIHSIDIVRYLIGLPVVEIQGHIARRVLTMIEVEDEADAAIKFSNGAVYAFSATNYYIKNSPIRIEVSGEKGKMLLTESVVEIELDGQEKRVIYPSQGANVHGEAYWGSYHTTQIRKYYEALEQGLPVPHAPEDALRTLAVVLGIYKSGKNGEMPVKPEYV